MQHPRLVLSIIFDMKPSTNYIHEELHLNNYRSETVLIVKQFHKWFQHLNQRIGHKSDLGRHRWLIVSALGRVGGINEAGAALIRDEINGHFHTPVVQYPLPIYIFGRAQ